jgi:hypothetical protein
MVYIVLILISLYAFYKLYKYLKGWWTVNGRPKVLTAPPLEASASTGPGGLGNTININIKTSNDSLVGDPEAIPTPRLRTIPKRGNPYSQDPQTPFN